MQFKLAPQTPDMAAEKIADSPENTAMKAKQLYKRVMTVAELLASSGQEIPIKSTPKTSQKTQK